MDSQLHRELAGAASAPDQPADQRTAELAAANEELRKEIEERRLVEARLRHSIEERKWAETQLAGDKQLLEMIATGRPLGDVLAALCRFVEDASPGCHCGVYFIDWSGPTFQYGVAPSLPPSYLEPIGGLPVRRDIAPCGVAAIEKTQVIVADIEADPRWSADYRDHVLTHGLRSVWRTPICSLEGRVFGTFCVYQRKEGLPSQHQQDLIAQVTHIASIAIDRSQAEAALTKLRADLAHVARISSLGVLTASIAHEVSQPLAGILVNGSTGLRMLGSDPPNLEGARETLRRAIRDANRASDVIGHLRALFGKKGTTKETVDLNDAAGEVVTLSRRQLEASAVVVRSELTEGLLPVVGDRVQLQQVILNLLLNAADAMSSVEEPARLVVIKTEREEGDRVRLIVQDAGLGIDAKNAEILFDAFYTTKEGGMGIGLSVSRSIIEDHGGRIWAAPNDGPGASFAFSLPGQSPA